jgi:hypothetical protein
MPSTSFNVILCICVAAVAGVALVLLYVYDKLTRNEGVNEGAEVTAHVFLGSDKNNGLTLDSEAIEAKLASVKAKIAAIETDRRQLDQGLAKYEKHMQSAPSDASQDPVRGEDLASQLSSILGFTLSNAVGQHSHAPLPQSITKAGWGARKGVEHFILDLEGADKDVFGGYIDTDACRDETCRCTPRMNASTDSASESHEPNVRTRTYLHEHQSRAKRSPDKLDTGSLDHHYEITVEALQQFYRIHAPEKIGDAAEILRQLDGQDDVTIQAFRKKYGAVPVRRMKAKDAGDRDWRRLVYPGCWSPISAVS